MHHPRQDNTYCSLCYTSRGALAGTRNSSMGPPWRVDLTTRRPWANTLNTEIHLAPLFWNAITYCFFLIMWILVNNNYLNVMLNKRRKEGNILFNDTLNTFYLWLYGVTHMVKDHSDSERGNLLPPHGLLFLISSKDYFTCIIPERITHTTALASPVVEHWLEREIAQWVHHEGLIWRRIAPWANAVHTELHLAPLFWNAITICFFLILRILIILVNKNDSNVMLNKQTNTQKN